MTPYEDKQRRFNWKLGIVAFILSIFVHQLIFWGLDLIGLFDEEKVDHKMEVSLRHEKKTEKKKAKTKKEVAPKPTPPAPMPTPSAKPVPRPKPLPQPSPKVKRQQPNPKPLPDPPPPVPQEMPMGPQIPDSVATAPTPPVPAPPKLQTKLNWGAFERTMGKTAEQERIAYQDKSIKKRGGGFKFGKMSARVQRSINDRRSWVAGAPKEPVGTKSAVFRNYLEATHEQIHQLFADSFLPSLVSLGSNHPLNDFSLMTLVEFRILENGTVDDIHVIRTSGQAVFDAAPVDTLYRASPFLPPPKSVLSYDNSVYFRWGFYRNQRKCGTFNATGYILTGPSGVRKPLATDQFQIIDG